jgi:hypothetical protein
VRSASGFDEWSIYIFFSCLAFLFIIRIIELHRYIYTLRFDICSKDRIAFAEDFASLLFCGSEFIRTDQILRFSYCNTLIYIDFYTSILLYWNRNVWLRRSDPVFLFPHWKIANKLMRFYLLSNMLWFPTHRFCFMKWGFLPFPFIYSIGMSQPFLLPLKRFNKDIVKGFL